MRDSIRAGTLFMAGCFALACSPAKTKQPVETTTEAGKSTSPSGAAADKRGTTLVRAVNALPDKRHVDVAAEQRVLFTNVGYQDVTDYAELPDNVARFTVRPVGKDSALAENREVMGDGARYTLVALPDGKGGTLLRVLRDELATDSSKAKIRVINAAAGLEDVKVTLQGQVEPLFDNIGLGIEAGYKDIEPTTATLLFQRSKGAPVVRVDKWKLEPGRAYTIVLTGTAGRKVEAVKFDDRLVRSGSQVSLKP
ncbi:MAG TPA: DUF4397 domain-containing protein [Gemmatimonadales bacterium]|nr:DUF4397 domain-containing protein [Gemmatimonadales bacterium]